ncbi:MAG: hypothetical protein ACKN9D_13815, partial [Actinomycetales bacterium]
PVVEVPTPLFPARGTLVGNETIGGGSSHAGIIAYPGRAGRENEVGNPEPLVIAGLQRGSRPQ